MRIAVVHSFYESSQPSGENSVVRDQVEALSEAGHEVTLIARETDVVQSEPFYKLRSAFNVMTGYGPDPTAELTRFQPDVVHVHNTFPNWGTNALRPWATRMVVTVHNFRPLCAASTLFRDGSTCTDCLKTPVLPAVVHACYRASRAATLPLAIGTRPHGPTRTLLAESAAVLVLNDEALAIYSRSLRRQIDLLPNYVERIGKARGGHRQGWVFVGRFTHEKGIVNLLRSWPTGESLDVIGAGPRRADVMEAAQGRMGVRILAPMDRNDLRARLAEYEGLVLPSLWTEGLPTVILEGLAAGTPAIISSSVASGQALLAAGAAETYDPALGEGEIAQALSAVRGAGGKMRSRAEAVHARTYSRESWLQGITSIYERVSTS